MLIVVKKIAIICSLLFLFSCGETGNEDLMEQDLFEQVDLEQIDKSDIEDRCYVPYEQLKMWLVEKEFPIESRTIQENKESRVYWVSTRSLYVESLHVECSYKYPAAFSFQFFLRSNSMLLNAETEFDLSDVFISFSNKLLTSYIPSLKSFGVADDGSYNIKVNFKVDCYTRINNVYYKFYFNAKFNITLLRDKQYPPNVDIPCKVTIGIEF